MLFAASALISFIFAVALLMLLVLDIINNVRSRMNTWTDIAVDVSLLFGIVCTLVVSCHVFIDRLI